MKKFLQIVAGAAIALGEKLNDVCFAFLVRQGLVLQVYVGSTAGSSVANPPVLLWRGAGARTILGTSQTSGWSSASPRAGGIQQWQYISTNLTTDITAVGFFTDGKNLGMQIGDIMHVVQFTSAGSSFVFGSGVLTSSNSSAGFNLTTGGFITSTH